MSPVVVVLSNSEAIISTLKCNCLLFDKIIFVNGLLSKHAFGSQVLETYGTKNRSVLDVCEDLSCGVTTQLASEVEFPKKSNDEIDQFLENIAKIDLLIVDTLLDVDVRIPYFKVKQILNMSDIRYSVDEIIFKKPLKFSELNNIIDLTFSSKQIFTRLNKDSIYSESDSVIIKPDFRIDLTSKENEIISYLLSKDGYRADKRELFKDIWSYNEKSESKTIETHLYNLKKKLQGDIFIIENDICFLELS